MKGKGFNREHTKSGRPNKEPGRLIPKVLIFKEVSDDLGLQMTFLLPTNRSFRVFRASTIFVSCFHASTQGGCCRPFPDEELIRIPQVWFAKVVSTLFVYSRKVDCCLSYIGANLTPSIAFEVIRRFGDPRVGLEYLEFSRLNLNLRHCFVTYDFLLRSLCRAGLHESVGMLLEYMRSDGVLPDSSLLGFLVTSCVQACKFDLAKKLVVDAEGKEIWISASVYNNFLNALVNRNRVHEAVIFFKEHLAGQSPDTWTFNILIRGLCREGEVDRAFEFLKDMENFGCLPDVVTYNTLLNGLCRNNEIERGRALLKELLSRDDCSPDVVTYTSILSAYCKLGKMDKASVLFDEMCRSGIQPSLITFNVLIDGFGKAGNMIAAQSMSQWMVTFGCLPDVVTFTSLIDGYCRTGQLHIGLKLWDVMRARQLFPNAYTYSILINALCKENRLSEARDFIRQLNCCHVVPKPFLYNPVIDGFCKAGNVDEANLIVAEMEERRCHLDKFTFTILIIGHCMKGRMVEALDIFNKMLAIGCAPDKITVNSLTSCLLKAGMPNEAHRIIQVASGGLNSGFSSVRKTIPLRTNVCIPVAT